MDNLNTQIKDDFESEYELGVKLGDFVYYEHSDFDNYGIVYHIDKRKQIAKAVFSDNGTGSSDMWFDKFGSSFLTNSSYDVRMLNPVSLYEEDYDPDFGYYETTFSIYLGYVADFLYHVWNDDNLSDFSLHDCAEISFGKELQLIKTNFKQIVENNDALLEYMKNEWGYEI